MNYSSISAGKGLVNVFVDMYKPPNLESRTWAGTPESQVKRYTVGVVGHFLYRVYIPEGIGSEYYPAWGYFLPNLARLWTIK